MEHIGSALTELVADLIEREQMRGRDERVTLLSEAALGSDWFQPEYEIALNSALR